MTNFIDIGIHKIYLAGPFFTGSEPAQNKQAADILRGKGFEVFVPREHMIEIQLPTVKTVGLTTLNCSQSLTE